MSTDIPYSFKCPYTVHRDSLDVLPVKRHSPRQFSESNQQDLTDLFQCLFRDYPSDYYKKSPRRLEPRDDFNLFPDRHYPLPGEIRRLSMQKADPSPERDEEVSNCPIKKSRTQIDLKALEERQNMHYLDQLSLIVERILQSQIGTKQRDEVIHFGCLPQKALHDLEQVDFNSLNSNFPGDDIYLYGLGSEQKGVAKKIEEENAISEKLGKEIKHCDFSYVAFSQKMDLATSNEDQEINPDEINDDLEINLHTLNKTWLNFFDIIYMTTPIHNNTEVTLSNLYALVNEGDVIIREVIRNETRKQVDLNKNAIFIEKHKTIPKLFTQIQVHSKDKDVLTQRYRQFEEAGFVVSKNTSFLQFYEIPHCYLYAIKKMKTGASADSVQN